MIINIPEIKKEDGWIILSCDIEIETKDYAKRAKSSPMFSKIWDSPIQKLWYKLPEEYEKFITKSCNPFVSAMIFPAMEMKEDIIVKGEMSYKLHCGLTTFMDYFSTWYHEEYKQVNINCANLIEKSDPNKYDKKIMSTFSGGVDGFYTLYKHLPGKVDKRSEINYCLFAYGLDFHYNEINDNYEIIKNEYKKYLEKYNIKLIPMYTNFREIVDSKAAPIRSVGTFLSSIGLCLESLCSKFYISAGEKYNDIMLNPDGSNFITDHLFSTENLDIKNDGAELSRIEKLNVLSYFPEAYDKLRPCQSNNLIGLNNCCNCSKCIRDMLSLEILGTLDKFTTFSKCLKREDIRNWEIWGYIGYCFAKDIYNEVKNPERKEDVHIAINTCSKNMRKIKSVFVDEMMLHNLKNILEISQHDNK